jgi:hypothetical protein
VLVISQDQSEQVVQIHYLVHWLTAQLAQLAAVAVDQGVGQQLAHLVVLAVVMPPIKQPLVVLAHLVKETLEEQVMVLEAEAEAVQVLQVSQVLLVALVAQERLPQLLAQA